MTLVNHDTGELIETLTVDQARRLTDRIRLLGTSVADSLDKMAELIDQARTGSAWLVLGHRSWTEYVSNEFAGLLPRLDREPRQELVRELAARGMSTRAIAPVVGVSKDTVHRDLSPVSDETPQTPSPTIPPGEPVSRDVGLGQTSASESPGEGDNEADADPESGAYVEAPSPATNSPRTPVIGLDGKNYTIKPNPKFLAAEAVNEFPLLAYYVESDRGDEAVRIAKALRAYDRDEQDRRLELLRKTIRAERKRAGEVPEPPSAEEIASLRADEIFSAANIAAISIERAGGSNSIRQAIAHVEQTELDNWLAQFQALARICTDLADACKPSLRRIK